MNPHFRSTENPSQAESWRNILRIVALCVLIGLFCTAISLFGCSKAPQDMIFDSVQQCASSGAYTLDECQTKFADAQKDFQTNAPKFTSKAQCEAQFGSGNCETRQSAGGNGDFFGPFMFGYMMGGGFNSYPVYRSYGGGYSTYDTVHHTTTVINKTVVINPTNVAPVSTAARQAASNKPAVTSTNTGPSATTKLAPVTTTPTVTKTTPTVTTTPSVSRPTISAPRTSVPSVGRR